MTQQDDRAVPVSEAVFHAVQLEQCSLFVDSKPLARAMTDAAKYLRATQAPAGVGLREAVARVIAPDAFEHNGHLQQFNRGGHYFTAMGAFEKADAILALTPPAQSSGPGEVERLRSAMLVTRGSIGDLRKGFAKSVDPERWVQQAIAHIDKALTPNASEPRRDQELQEIEDGAYGEGPAMRGRARDMLKAQRAHQPGAASSGELREALIEAFVKGTPLDLSYADAEEAVEMALSAIASLSDPQGVRDDG